MSINDEDITAEVPGPDYSSVHDHRQRQGLMDHSQRRNHELRLRGGVATPAQVAATEHALRIFMRAAASADTLGSSDFYADPIARGGLALRLTLDLGRDPEQLSRLTRIDLDTATDARPIDWGLVSWQTKDGIKHGWWLPAGVHVHSKSLTPDEAVRGSVWLPLLARTQPWLALEGETQIVSVRSPILKRTPEGVEEDMTAFIKWARGALSSLGKALPLPQALARSLSDQMAWQPTGDRTLANHISGQDIKRSTSRSYYSSLSSVQATNHYMEAVRSPPCHSSLTTDSAGNQNLAIPSFLQKARTLNRQKTSIDTLKDILILQPARLDRRRNIVDEHAALITRVWIVLALSTAARGITRWVPGVQRLEPRTGALIVMDKDRTDTDLPIKQPSKTLGSALGPARLVFLHPVARALLAHYQDHLKKLAGRKDLDDNASKLLQDHTARLQNGELVPFLEIARHNEKQPILAHEVAPSWIKARIQAQLSEDLSPNFARHALRSGLIGHIPQAAIDALLGHFDHGTEHWSNGSAFDPVSYRAMSNAVFEGHFKDVASFKNNG